MHIVLLVDPHARDRAESAEMLTRCGCSVVAVRDADDAIETFTAHHQDIALVIVDAEVPPHGAASMLHELHQISSRVPLFLSTTAETSPSDAGVDGTAGILQMPLQAEALAKILPKHLAPEPLATLPQAHVHHEEPRAPSRSASPEPAQPRHVLPEMAPPLAPPQVPTPVEVVRIPVEVMRAPVEVMRAPVEVMRVAVPWQRSRRAINATMVTAFCLALTTYVELRSDVDPTMSPSTDPAHAVNVPPPRGPVVDVDAERWRMPGPLFVGSPPGVPTRVPQAHPSLVHAALARAPETKRRTRPAVTGETRRGVARERRARVAAPTATEPTATSQVSKRQERQPTRSTARAGCDSPACADGGRTRRAASFTHVATFIRSAPRVVARAFTALRHKIGGGRESSADNIGN